MGDVEGRLEEVTFEMPRKNVGFGVNELREANVAEVCAAMQKDHEPKARLVRSKESNRSTNQKFLEWTT